MFDIKRARRKPGITTSSMSDIGFLLLIFIMLISLMNQRYEEHIEYSEAVKLERTQVEHNFEIWIQKDGTVSVDGKIVNLQTLERLIIERIAETPDARIHVIADKNTPYKHVNSVISILQFLQHRVVSFVVKETN